MARARVRSVCGSCRWHGNCKDADALEQLRSFIENSQLAAEFALAGRTRFRLGCERYESVRQRKTAARPYLRLIVANDADLPCS